MHVPEAFSPHKRSISMTPLLPLEVLRLSLNPSATGYWNTAALTVVALVAGALARLTVVAVRSPLERPRALGLAAVIMSVMGVAVSVSVSRFGFGPGVGLLSRYVSTAKNGARIAMDKRPYDSVRHSKAVDCAR